MRRLDCLLLAIMALGLAAVAGWFVVGWSSTGPLERDIAIVVPEGASLRGMAGKLEEQGAIRSADTFLMRVRLLGRKGVIKAGEYEIPKGASNARILQILQSGKTINYLVAVPEGMPS